MNIYHYNKYGHGITNNVDHALYFLWYMVSVFLKTMGEWKSWIHNDFYKINTRSKKNPTEAYFIIVANKVMSLNSLYHQKTASNQEF